jgi:hypothetical protein
MVFGRIFSDIRISAINVKTEHIEMARQKNSVRQIIQYKYIKYHEWSLM